MTIKLEDSYRTLKDLPTEKALSESFQLGGNAIKILALDPMLPEQLINTHLRQQLSQSMLKYEAMGRPLWLDALESLNH